MSHFVGEDEDEIVRIVILENRDRLSIILPFVKGRFDAVERVIRACVAVLGRHERFALCFEFS